MMREVCEWAYGLRHGLLMVVVEMALAGANIFYKVAASDGMNLRVLIAYRYIFATAFMVPLALLYERNNRPRLTWRVLFLSFLCGLFGGSLSQNLLVESLAFTSATFSTAMFHLLPAITFIFSVCFGLERLGIGSLAGKAKVMGTLIGIIGAMVLTFYKGPLIQFWTNLDLLNHSRHRHRHVSSIHASNYIFGALLAVGSCSFFALWLIIQAKLSIIYPCHYSATALMSLMAAIQSIVAALCMEKDWSQWKLGWNIRLIATLYLGIVGSGLVVAIMTWCVRARGPLFVAIFQPLMLVGVAFVGSLLLDEKLHLGSLLGAALIVWGLYMVLWGKSQEMKKINQSDPQETKELVSPKDPIISNIGSRKDKNNGGSSPETSNELKV